MYTHLERTQELADQLALLKEESQYAGEHLRALDAAQCDAVRELEAQHCVFDEIRFASDQFMVSLEEQLLALTMATPRYLDTIGIHLT